ncbi:hypothetical protein BDZ89DRAFT_1050377 [Hymenopellis radicata]|nr:hypothetical protein BDZ89DRAFT_1050377 [Hymenopellis radicata]
MPSRVKRNILCVVLFRVLLLTTISSPRLRRFMYNSVATVSNDTPEQIHDVTLVVGFIEEPELVNYTSIRRLMAADQTYASFEDDLESVLWVFVKCVLRTFAMESAAQLFRLFMMDPPANVAQQKKAFLRGAFDDVTFLPEVSWLHDLLCELCQDRAISSQTFRRYGLDNLSICDEEDSSLFSDSGGSTYNSESESEENRRPSGKLKIQNLMRMFTLKSGRDGITFGRVWM